jgi:MinD superfamily P-loop ATPase
MKQLLILSGKGGTGKTTIASAFIKLCKAKAYADCDVDAPNLHLITNQDVNPIKSDFYGLNKAEINQDLCISCGLCNEHCRFDAIHVDHNTYSIDYFKCEGCGVCAKICPSKAITMKPAVAGVLELYKNKESVFSTAKLTTGNGNSGLLVSEVKNQMKNNTDSDFAIIDGSPGIGCPVIASLSGVDMALIVVEPSLSGISDMDRVIQTAYHFHPKIAVCINKYDINLKNSEKIKQYCKANSLLFLGEIPYDTMAVKAVNKGMSVVEIDCISGDAIKKLYKETIELFIN